MDFSVAKDLSFQQAVEIMFSKLGTHKVMALATSVSDHVTVRNVSCIFYDGLVWFKTDINFRKTKQIFANPNVALCWSGVQIEGSAEYQALKMLGSEDELNAFYRTLGKLNENLALLAERKELSVEEQV